MVWRLLNRFEFQALPLIAIPTAAAYHPLNSNCTDESIFILQEQNVRNIPLPTFTSGSHLAVTDAQGPPLPSKVLFAFLIYSVSLSFSSNLYLNSWILCMTMFRYHRWSMTIKLSTLLTILLMWNPKQIQLLEIVPVRSHVQGLAVDRQLILTVLLNGCVPL